MDRLSVTQVTPENSESAIKLISEKATKGHKSLFGRYKQTVAVLLIALLLILVGFLLVRMNSLGNQLALIQANPVVGQDSASQSDGQSNSSLNQDASNKNVDISKYRVIASKFSALNSRATQLKFSQIENVSATKPIETTPKKILVAPANSEMKWWNAVGEKVLLPIGNFFKDLVKIQVIEDPAMRGAASGVAISPVAQALVRQQMLSYLLSARQFVLLEMPKEALGDLQEVRLIVVKNFASQNADTLAFIDGLTQIENELKVLASSAQSIKPAEKK
jgi:hypothetical protein